MFHAIRRPTRGVDDGATRALLPTSLQRVATRTVKAVYGLFPPKAVLGPCFSTGNGIVYGDGTDGETGGPFMGLLAVDRISKGK